MLVYCKDTEGFDHEILRQVVELGKARDFWPWQVPKIDQGDQRDPHSMVTLKTSCICEAWSWCGPEFHADSWDVS